MDQKIREMQERLDKIGTGRPIVPPAQNVDYSEMQARLDKVGTSYRSFVAPAEVIDRSEMQARLNNAAPVAKTVSIPTPKVTTQELPVSKSISTTYKSKSEELPKPQIVPKPLPPVPEPVVELTIPKPIIVPEVRQQALDTLQPRPQASRSPHVASQSKGRSSWILWVGIALFVAIVIAQLIWVMS